MAEQVVDERLLGGRHSQFVGEESPEAVPAALWFLACFHQSGVHQVVRRGVHAQTEGELGQVSVEVGRPYRLAGVEILHQQLQLLAVAPLLIVHFGGLPQRRWLPSGAARGTPDGLQDRGREVLLQGRPRRIIWSHRRVRAEHQDAEPFLDAGGERAQLPTLRLGRTGLGHDASLAGYSRGGGTYRGGEVK